MNIEPNLYCKYAGIEKVVNLICVRFEKSLYGLFHSALIFYLKLATDMKNDGLGLNPYNPCVSNQLVNGYVMIVVWYV